MRPAIYQAMTVAAALCAAVLLAGWQSRRGEVTGDAVRGHAIAGTRCAACHGVDGNGGPAPNPRLAGQDASYLYRQLRAFSDGARAGPVMAPIASTLSDGDMRDVAAYFAQQTRHGDPPAAATLRAEGRSLFLEGSVDGAVPACATCHDASRDWVAGAMGSMRGMGMAMPMMGRNGPQLFGQRAGYVERRLQGIADGTPEGVLMSRIAASMTPQQKRAVAAYIAGHP